MLESVDCGDVRMIQGREGLRFAFEAGHTFRITGEHIRQDFECDLSAEDRVGSSINLSHPSFADGRDNLIDAEPGSGRKSQSCSYCLAPDRVCNMVTVGAEYTLGAGHQTCSAYLPPAGSPPPINCPSDARCGRLRECRQV